MMSAMYSETSISADGGSFSGAAGAAHEAACGCGACAGSGEGAGDGLSGLSGAKPVWANNQVIANLLRSNSAWPQTSTIFYSFR